MKLSERLQSKILLPIFINLALCVVPAHANWLQQNEVIVVAGDSITANADSGIGFLTDLRNYLYNNYRPYRYAVYGSGFSGDTSINLDYRFEGSVLNLHPTIVVLFIGVNDVGHGVPLSTTLSHVQHMIDTALAAPPCRAVVVMSPLCIGESYDGRNYYDGGLNNLERYLQQYPSLYPGRVAFMDLRDVWRQAEYRYNFGDYQRGVLTMDGVHPNVLGNLMIEGTLLRGFGL